MRQYRIDELRPGEYEKIRDYLDEHYGSGQVDGLYWIPMEDQYLNDVQAAHKDCQPFYFAVELDRVSASFELLVRTRKRIRCDCIGYANPLQRERIIQFAENLFESLKILS